MNLSVIIEKLELASNPANVAGMARYGINPRNTLGVSVRDLRSMAKKIGKNHALALQLWDSDIHEARILATLVDIPEDVTEEQTERWVLEFDSWDICDLCCNNLFRRTVYAFEKARAWSIREEEFVKRAGFVLMATLAVHARKEEDGTFREFLDIVEAGACDERNFVKKAVNWALRQIGKRNRALNGSATETARRIIDTNGRAARWIGRDALRELTTPAVQGRLKD